MTRTDLIKRIHVLKRDLALDDETYRMILFNISGERSCKDIDQEGLNLVFLSLRKMVETTQRVVSTNDRANEKQQKQIARLMSILVWRWSDVAGLCKRIVDKNSTKNCTASELSKVIRALIGIIDNKLSKGEIVMTHTQRFEYERHVRGSRQGGMSLRSTSLQHATEEIQINELTNQPINGFTDLPF